MILIDMHVHSVYSDGACTVEELARKAKSQRLSLLSLTDHDTTDGIVPFLQACRHYKVPALAGLELAADEDFTLHILGYRIDPLDKEMALKLAELRRRRCVRNAEICEKLRELGFAITIDEVEAEANGAVIARPHIAAVMRKKGYITTTRQAFEKYIGLGCQAYVSRALLSAEECIAMIKKVGGLAVMAHPLQTKLSADGFDRLLARLKEAGLWGIEVVYTGYSPEQVFELMKIADKYSLYMTAGSDFHGSCLGSMDLGMPVSEDFLPWARLGIS